MARRKMKNYQLNRQRAHATLSEADLLSIFTPSDARFNNNLTKSLASSFFLRLAIFLTTFIVAVGQ